MKNQGFFKQIFSFTIIFLLIFSVFICGADEIKAAETDYGRGQTISAFDNHFARFSDCRNQEKNAANQSRIEVLTTAEKIQKKSSQKIGFGFGFRAKEKELEAAQQRDAPLVFSVSSGVSKTIILKVVKKE